MQIQCEKISSYGMKFYIEQDNTEIARAYLYILNNDLHKEPFAFMENVFVDDSLRGKGIGSLLVKKIIEGAKSMGCYKLICTSRHSKLKVHELYEKLGFKNHGLEFRIDF
jgi:GNAT superfamily N-acetyltransferase